MPPAFLRTFRKLHLYVHKTVQKHGITSIVFYINIPTVKITTRFSLAKTYFQGNCLWWAVKKYEMSRIISVRFWGEGLLIRNRHGHFQKTRIKSKRVNSFYQSSLESMLKSPPPELRTQGLRRSMYTTPPTIYLFIHFFHTTRLQRVLDQWGERKQKKKKRNPLPVSLQLFVHLSTGMITVQYILQRGKRYSSEFNMKSMLSTN